jgi:type IV fimbrial biogenesis protein FimT
MLTTAEKTIPLANYNQPLVEQRFVYTRAFTLVELLVTLVIVVILATIAVPSSHYFLTSNRSTAHINALAHALYFARSEAIQRGEKMTFCSSADGKKCGGDWCDGQVVMNPAKEVLRIFPALPKSDYLVWNSSGGKDTVVEWLPTGYTNGQRGTFYYCSHAYSRGDAQGYAGSRSLVLLDTGRWYVTAMTEKDFQEFCSIE